MELIPAIDIIDGKCVRLAKGDFNEKIIYSDNPLGVARSFENAGIKRLHIVDLDGAEGEPLKNIAVLEIIANDTSLVIDFGGGVKTTDNVKSVLSAGASMVSLGSILVKDPGLFSEWIRVFGAARFLPGADVFDKKIRIQGWKTETDIYIFSFIRRLTDLGINTIFCTDISRDGMLQGPSIELYNEILQQFPSLYLIASGGVSSYEDLLQLKDAGCSGAIIGKAFYENRITLKQIEQYLKNE